MPQCSCLGLSFQGRWQRLSKGEAISVIAVPSLCVATFLWFYVAHHVFTREKQAGEISIYLPRLQKGGGHFAMRKAVAFIYPRYMCNKVV